MIFETMRFRALKYSAVYAIPFSVWISLNQTELWTFSAVFFAFGVVPFLELFFKGSTTNLSDLEEELVKKDWKYDLILYSLVPMQYFLLVFFLFQINQPELSLFSKIGMSFSMGVSCGVVGINGAHELGHRSSKWEQFMAKMMLATSLYMHFFIEHNRGHHKNVSTPEDPSSGRFGEALYPFWIRSVRDSWLSAWELEATRLQRINSRTFSFKNEMILYVIVQCILVFLILCLFDGQTVLFFFGSAVIGFLLLETVNYIEHYGLVRKKKGNRYERTLPSHSWNSNHPLGRLMLLELSRHSDHHFIASRKYATLRHHEESPQMPTGYPGMMLLALFPPLWFRVMNPMILMREANQKNSK